MWWHVAPAGRLSCWSKGSLGNLSLITGAAEDWGKVIKGAPAPAVPWQETDQTNLCSFLYKINVQFKILLLTRPASPKWQCTIFLASVFYILLFLCHYHFSYCAVFLSLPWHPSPSVSLCYLCLWLSFFLVMHLPSSSLCNGPQSSHVVIGHFTELVHTLWRGEFIKPGHTHSVTIRGWAISIPKLHDAKNSLAVS